MNQAIDNWTDENEFPAVYVKPASLKAGDFIQGTFVSMGEEGEYEQTVLRVKLTAPLTYGDSKTPLETYAPGTLIGINAPGQLVKRVRESGLSAGEERRYVYLGMETMKKGKQAGKEAHIFKIQAKKGNELPE